MRISPRLFGATAFCLLASLGTALGPIWSTLQRDLELAALKGLDADAVFNPDWKDVKEGFFRGAPEAAATPEYATIPIDHNNPRYTYRNRYWVNDAYYRPGGPVIIFDGGEGDAQGLANYYLEDQTSYIVQLLQEFGGVGLVWEHRYYGQSNPYPVNDNTPASQLQYLSNEQALNDLPYFARTFRRRSISYDLTPRSTPWVMIGGSYPGMRAAFSRLKHPDTIFAALSSSAPVQARIDFSAYYEQVYRGLIAYGYGNCTRDMQAAYQYIDSQLAQQNTATYIKQLFLGPGAERNTHGVFTQALLAVWVTWQTYGPTGEVAQFCNWMETDPRTGRTAPAEGWAPTRGVRAVVERFAAWPNFRSRVNAAFGSNCGKGDCDLKLTATDPAAISWAWQFCSQWGYFQTRNPSGIISIYQTDDYFQRELCYSQFPDGVSSGHLPARPGVDQANNYTSGWYTRPSNVFFTGGEFDPWNSLSTLSTESYAPRARVTTRIPQCNQPTPRSEVFGYLIPHAEHCYDLRTDVRSGEYPRSLFRSALRQWLPCFRRRN
ncbi:predicted protein [Uncinocarpus reesii 1704]|uniref:Thymus-specific serine protease n=1 Tax=Uncinocarpus reesii (strain UAMH 1704) TaxID=336963 RepID=C4JNK2_UNCRE|nr:uncharacterized protein UREG_03000 [Uncinocarpus reesii 1704]EEP78155.1 predicted protein [Uncinocarpus reesii 1704]